MQYSIRTEYFIIPSTVPTKILRGMGNVSLFCANRNDDRQ